MAFSFISKFGAAVDERTQSGQTALHLACLKGEGRHNNFQLSLSQPLTFLLVYLVERLLSTYNADVNATDDDGDTPLHYAANAGHLNVTAPLLEAHAHLVTQNKQGINISIILILLASSI